MRYMYACRFIERTSSRRHRFPGRRWRPPNSKGKSCCRPSRTSWRFMLVEVFSVMNGGDLVDTLNQEFKARYLKWPSNR